MKTEYELANWVHKRAAFAPERVCSIPMLSNSSFVPIKWIISGISDIIIANANSLIL